MRKYQWRTIPKNSKQAPERGYLKGTDPCNKYHPSLFQLGKAVFW
jgi:hypothetical protein